MSAANNALVIAGLGSSLLVTLAVIASEAPARVLVGAPSNDNSRWTPRLVSGFRRAAAIA
jgi:hypothetical protein